MTASRSAPGWPVMALAALVTAPHAAAGDPTAAVAGIQRHYRTAASLSARFRQTYRAPGVETVESGVLYFKRPGLMRWEYREPEPKLFVADGRRTYLYTPADRQVLVSRFAASELRSTPFELLLGGGAVGAFRATEEGALRASTGGAALVRLYPRPPRPEYEWVVVEFDSGTFEVRRIVVQEATGATSEFALTDIRLNAPVRAAHFRFEAPKGVEEIQVDPETP